MAATACLTLGIGVNIVLIAAFESVLLRPLPFRAPEELVAIGRLENDAAGAGDSGPFWYASERDIRAWSRATRTLSGIGAFDTDAQVVIGSAGPESVTGAIASPSLGKVLSLRLLHGRWFGEDEVNDRVIVIGQQLWTRQFGNNPSVIGSLVRIGGEARTVIGVLQRDQSFPLGSEYWIPWPGGAAQVIGRQLSHVTAADIAHDLDAISPSRVNVRRTGPTARILIVPLREHLFGVLRQPLALLLGAGTLLLLLACANVANLTLTRTLERQKELALRLSLGARRRSLVLLLLAENLVVAVSATLAALLVGTWSLKALMIIGPEQLRAGELRIGPLTILAAAGLAAIVALAVSLGPVVVMRETRLRSLVDDANAVTGRPTASRSRSLLVASQVALAILLMSGASLLIAGAAASTAEERLGFDPDSLTVATIQLTSEAYHADWRRKQFISSFIDAARALPGVRSVAVGPPPLVAGTGEWIREGFDALVLFSDDQRSDVAATTVWVKHVDPEYFRTYGIRPLRGRLLELSDDTTSLPVAVVNRTAARLFFGADWNAARHHTLPILKDAKRQVVGIVADALQSDVSIAARAEVYLPMAQQPITTIMPTFGVRAPRPESIVNELRDVVLALDPTLAPMRLASMRSIVGVSIARLRFLLTVLVIFAALALAIGCIGVFALVSYSVNQRTRELSIRLALGAETRHIFGVVMAEAAQFVTLGAVSGLLAAYWFNRSLLSIAPVRTDSFQMRLTVTALLFLCALCAAAIPVWKATHLNPGDVLRSS